MPGLLPRALGRSAGYLSFWVFLVTVVLCLFRARDLPAVAFDAQVELLTAFLTPN